MSSSGSNGGLGSDGWNYLACTEMVMPTPSNGKTDMYYPSLWDAEGYVEYCKSQYGPALQTSLNYAQVEFGGKDIEAASNIVFSNGQLDPWRGGGLTTTLNPSLPAYYIELSAHHLDLRASNPADPKPVVEARVFEVEQIKRWIAGPPPPPKSDAIAME